MREREEGGTDTKNPGQVAGIRMTVALRISDRAWLDG